MRITFAYVTVGMMEVMAFLNATSRGSPVILTPILFVTYA